MLTRFYDNSDELMILLIKWFGIDMALTLLNLFPFTFHSLNRHIENEHAN